MSDTQNQLFKILRDSQDKYAYFMLTAAGGAVALAVNQTKSSVLTSSQWPLAGAVFFWGMSFYCGCKYLEYISSILYANIELLRVEAGEHPRAGRHPQVMAAAAAGILAATESNISRAQRYATWQFRLLVVGAILYVVWHVSEMWIRTTATVPPLNV